MTSLDDALHKLERGKVHLSDFFSKIAVIFDTDQVKIEIKNQPHPKPLGSTDSRPWTAFTVCFSSVPVVPKADGILLGEAIQSFRSSLDYLAWSLARKHSGRKLGEGQKRGIKFPMAHSRNAFWNGISRCLPNVPHDQRKLFERYQPYRHSDVGRTIRHLKNLSNFDKHRIIVPTLMWPESGDINFEYRDAQRLEKIYHYIIGSKIKKGTKIMTVVLADALPNQGQVKVNTEFSVYPMFPKNILKPPPSQLAIPAQVVTDGISEVCTKILAEAANYF